MTSTRYRYVRFFGALFLVVLAARAEASGARIRWSPSPDTRVTGYRVYLRHAGAPYAAPIDAGRPTAAVDGSMAYVVNGLTAGQSYFFAVTAHAASLPESGFSQEVSLGTTNPCSVDRCAAPTSCEIRAAADGSSCDDGLFCNGIAVCLAGVCQNGPAPNCSDGVACTVDHCDEALARCVHVAQPGCCQTDAACADTDPCTTGEHCVSGSCVSFAAICPASSCAAAFCDPHSGCGLMPTPDGVNCQELCGVLAPRRLILGSLADGASLNLQASFQSDAPIDPTVRGMTIEIAGPTGAVVYAATVPSDRFVSKLHGSKFRYLAKGNDALATSGISGIVLKLRHGIWSLKVRGIAAALVDALGQPQLALTVRFEGACARDPQLICAGDLANSSICR